MRAGRLIDPLDRHHRPRPPAGTSLCRQFGCWNWSSGLQPVPIPVPVPVPVLWTASLSPIKWASQLKHPTVRNQQCYHVATTRRHKYHHRDTHGFIISIFSFACGTRIILGVASECYTLHQFSKEEFMDSCKLWPADKQLNECINMDDMLQAYGKDIRPPLAVGWFWDLPPHLGLWAVHMFGTGRTVNSGIYNLGNKMTADLARSLTPLSEFYFSCLVEPISFLRCDGICWGATCSLIKDTCHKSSHPMGQSCWGGEKNNDGNRKMLVNIVQTWSPSSIHMHPPPPNTCSNLPAVVAHGCWKPHHI